MKQITKRLLVLVTIILLNPYIGSSQEVISVIQDGNLVLLDASTGAIQDPSFIVLDAGTPKASLQVGDEIWISYQIGDKIERYDFDGNLLSTIEDGLDNIKGMSLVNNSEVWVTNAGANNGAPERAIVRFDFEGGNLGFFLTDGISSFDIVDTGDGEVYISYIGASTSKIERRDYEGNFLGNIVEPGVVNFIQQIQIDEPGIIIAAVFSIISGGNQNGLYRFSETDGSIIDFWNEGNLRGVAKLGNGNILWSSAAGVHSLNPNTGLSTLISSGSAQYFGRLNLSGCTTLPDAPTGDATQTLCNGETIADLIATGSNIKWYDDEVGGTQLSSEEPLVSGVSYFASQTVDGCESEDRFEVQVVLNIANAPTGDDQQTFTEGAILSDIVIDPVSVIWYATEADAIAGTNPLSLNTVLVDGETYYAVNVVDDCSSESFAVTVTITLSLNNFLNSNLNFYPNPTRGVLYLNYNQTISEVVISNILGQIVLKESTNSDQIEIDMTSFPNSTYLVKIVSKGNTKTVKVIKN